MKKKTQSFFFYIQPIVDEAEARRIEAIGFGF